MSNLIKAVRGMNAVLPAETPPWQYLEETVRAVLESYGYEEIRLPILEHTSLFARSIGDHTDIVEKEMYTFVDRNGESLTLRPEATAGCVRAGLEMGLLYNQSQRLWYMGPMFRHERPQQGRYRQFHQIGVEAFGMTGPDIDAELLLMTARIWRRLGLTDLKLQINSLGTSESRAVFRQRLIDYFSRHREALDEDSQRRLSLNPLRILDSKNPAMQRLIAQAPTLIGHLDKDSAAHFAELKSLLEAAGVHYEVNPRLVRGLDYYTKTVFEWITDRLGAQGTVCAGGRYDGLVEQMGGKPTPAAGFAMGLERLVALLDRSLAEKLAKPPHVYLIAVGEEVSGEALKLAEWLRDALPGLRLLTHCGSGSFKSQFRHADKRGAKLALVLGPDELARGSVGVKCLDEDLGQVTLPQGELAAYLRQALGQRGISLEHPHPCRGV